MESNVSSPTSQLSHHVVQAGAGAGKTRSLVEKVVSVFHHYRETENRNPRMIVTTFTRKATQELRERLIVRACEVRDADLLEYVGNARSLHISTIHGVLNLFLGQVGHLCQLEAGFRVIHETEERQVARVALKKTLLSAKEYLAWVEDYSFQQLLSTLIRFSKALQQDPMLRPASLDDIQRIRMEAVNDWCVELDNIARIILETPVEDAKWTEFAHVLKNLSSSWDGSLSGLEAVEKPRKNAKSALPVEIQEEVAEALAKVKKEVTDASEFEEFWPYFAQKWSEFEELGRRFHHEFKQAKLSEGLLSISDLEMFSLEVLRQNPELGGNFALGWDFWLIDEYQDTSPVQAELLQLLRGQAPAFVVGDPQQSIYLFRGARSEIFHEKIEEAKRTKAQIDRLMINYRSEPALLEFLNDFFAGYSEQFEPMQPRQAVQDEQKLVASFISGADVAEENAGILSHIAKLLRQGARFEDICLLGRTHSHLGDLATVLKAHGIPLQVHSPTGFWRRREVLDAMSLLKFLVHPHDNLTVLSLLRSPGYRIQDTVLADFSQKQPKSLWNSFLASAEFAQHEAILHLQELLVFRKENGLVAAFERALRDSGLIDLAFFADPSGRREANLWKLLAKVREEEKKPGFQILSLFDEIDGLLGDEGTAEGDAITAKEPNCVNLMTIHSSKGLEFDHVILPRMGVSPNLSTSDEFSHHEEDSLFSFPIYLEQEGQRISSVLDRRRLSELRRRELSEQDRWLYVALTRAKKTLALCWSDDRLENHSWAQRGRLPQAARFTRSQKYSAEVLRPPYVYEIETMQNQRTNEIRPLWKSEKSKATETQTVSQLTQSETFLTTKILLSRQEGATYGITMHRALQTLKVKPDIKWAIKTYPDLAESLQFVWNLDNPPLRHIILNGQVEWGFRIRNGSEILQGRIDLWGRDDQGRVWIVDYKSGRAREDESYWEQLKLYANAVRKFGAEGIINLALVHPLEKKVFVKQV
jgi:ATP-dependent helicase/nuclease subunit A